MAKRIVVGISGASGAIYAQRLIHHLVSGGAEVHLVVSPLGQRLLHDELGMEGIDLEALAGDAGPWAKGLEPRENQANGTSPSPGGTKGGQPSSPADVRSENNIAHRTSQIGNPITLHHYRDVGASIASGSFRHDGMVIVPCSNHSLAAIANGLSDNLMHRAANVALKERFGLILCHRETPLSLVEIRNMQAVTEAGATVMPASPGFYMLPQTIDDLVNFVVGRLLDLLKIDHDLNTRWTESEANYRANAQD